MGAKTKIEYCDSTVNPVMGCTGCELYPAHCYAARLCVRHAGRKGWPASFDQPEVFDHRIPQALGWSDLTGKQRPDKPWLDGYPRIVFVNDMGDGFCPDVDPYDWLYRWIPAMEKSPHIWLLLTKWPERMEWFLRHRGKPIPSNFWLGTSVCRQRDEWRIKELLRIQGAAVRWVSLEPVLETIDISPFLVCQQYAGELKQPRKGTIGEQPYRVARIRSRLDWVAAGGESGPGARLMYPAWVRLIRDQCVANEIPFFFKSWGTAKPDILEARRFIETGWNPDAKKRAGRLLDGQLWSEMPEVKRCIPS